MRIVQFANFLQDEVNDFFAKCLPESGRAFDPEGKHKPLTNIAENFRHFWVMVDDDQEIVGTVAIKELPHNQQYASVMHRNSAELKCLFLLKMYQGQGHGDKLLSFAIDQAKLFGYVWLYLDTHSDRSSTAIELYKKYGFEEITRYNDNPDANVFMRLRMK